MRTTILLAGALALFSACASAQLSAPFYINKDYRFAAIYPGEPVGNDLIYTNTSNDALPARRFIVEQDGNLHSVTVVDASSRPPIDLNLVQHAEDDLRTRGHVRFSAGDDYDPGIPGRQLDIVMPDGKQLRASVYMWDHKLFITEAHGTPGTISLIQFEQSITLLNPDGSELNLGR